MIEYLTVGLKALFVVFCLWLLAAFPLACAGVIDGEDAHGLPRHDVVVSATFWALLFCCGVVIGVGWMIDEILIPVAS